MTTSKTLGNSTLQAAQEINTKPFRVQSVDLLRGAVMIIMAIDHVRVYSGIPAGGTTPEVFFTRWITHYCAPAFAFFAGTSAFLFFQKNGSRSELFKFLVSRGLFLVILDVTVVRFLWTFNLTYVKVGVIWMLGWCMILMAAFIRLRPVTLGVIGLIIIFAQQLFHYVPAIFPVFLQQPVSDFWAFFYPSLVATSEPVSILGMPPVPVTFGIGIFYVILPWLGVMMAGFAFGQLLLQSPEQVKKICLRIGIAAILLFVIAGTVITLMGPRASEDLPFLLKLLGQQKYPPSQLFLLMTLGPVIALVPWAEKAKGWFADIVRIVGRVPMFYYLLHLLLIHLSAFVVNLILYGDIHQEWYVTASTVNIPEDQRWGLPILYLVWAVDVVILFFASRWYARYKSAHPEQVWTKYL